MLQPRVFEIITDFLKEGNKNYMELGNNLWQCKIIFQYLYSNVFPEIYCSTGRREFDLKSTFNIPFKTYKDKKKKKKERKKEIEQSGKNPQVFITKHVFMNKKQ